MTTKLAPALMVAVSLMVQFVLPMPDVPRLLVPLFLQMAVCIWWYVANQLE